jgi:hypothetical protein
VRRASRASTCGAGARERDHRPTAGVCVFVYAGYCVYVHTIYIYYVCVHTHTHTHTHTHCAIVYAGYYVYVHTIYIYAMYMYTHTHTHTHAHTHTHIARLQEDRSEMSAAHDSHFSHIKSDLQDVLKKSNDANNKVKQLSQNVFSIECVLYRMCPQTTRSSSSRVLFQCLYVVHMLPVYMLFKYMLFKCLYVGHMLPV